LEIKIVDVIVADGELVEDLVIRFADHLQIGRRVVVASNEKIELPVEPLEPLRTPLHALRSNEMLLSGQVFLHHEDEDWGDDGRQWEEIVNRPRTVVDQELE
jgi:hypothetical protein